jgi:hypothetical protein
MSDFNLYLYLGSKSSLDTSLDTNLGASLDTILDTGNRNPDPN